MRVAAIQGRNRPMMLASIGKKKGTPKGTFFVLLRARLHHPRQEPGRNFGFRFVPSTAALPQRQPKTVVPPTSAATIGAIAPPGFFSGTRVTTVPLIPLVPAKPWIVTVTFQLTSVAMNCTYFEAPPVVALVTSQPQLLIPGALVALWKTSVIEVRHALAAKITSDIFARLL